jgi:hypothetical protein
VDGRLGGASLCGAVDHRDAHLRGSEAGLSFHLVGQTRISVAAYNGRTLPTGARIALSTAPDFWNAARASGALTIVDAPALEHSRVALGVARYMDGVVIVVSANPGGAPAALAAKAALVESGANIIGLVYTQASAPVAAMDRVWRQAS